MLKRLKLKFMMIACLMLILMVGSYEAKAQVVCPGIPSANGWFKLDVSSRSSFTAGLLGTIESFNGSTVGGLDWLYNDDSFFNTTLTGSQLVSWWSQANGRNTFLQVTNTNTVSGVNVHVQILGSNCIEVRDFCDSFSPNDTHIYDLGNLFANNGDDIAEGNFQGDEGIITVTPVDSCPSPNQAISWNFFQGNLRIIDANNVDLGTNVYARPAESFDGFLDIGDTLDGINSGLDGSFPDQLKQQFSTVGGPAGADVVLMSINDSYGPPYSIFGGGATYSPGIYDIFEKFQSCGTFGGCFVRRGIDDVIPISDDFTPPSPTPTPCTSDADCTAPDVCIDAVAGACSTTTTTACFADSQCPTGETCEGEVIGVCGAPTSPTPTPTPTPKPGGGGGGGCAIAGPVDLGTAMANVILPLVPVAFAFGLGALRRRNRKEDK